MAFDPNNIHGREPLEDYPWRVEIDILLSWLKNKDSHVQAFCFDLMMSAAYIDATSGLEKHIERCNHSPLKYNAHLGFINLCSPCYSSAEKWSYQKAAKPQSGALGKLSSEVILRFIEKLYPELDEVIVVGGTEVADAVLKHSSGMTILAEVKSAPLLTYPVIFELSDSCLNGEHEKVTITTSQLRESDSAIYMHGIQPIKLGKVGDKGWPFKPLVHFLTNPMNATEIHMYIHQWLDAKEAYSKRDRTNKMYYLANASGSPLKIAKERDNWPTRESISDSKTSAGMDRTDDIKKAIYQALKIGAHIKLDSNIKTAIISNLPAYRHGDEYIAPFMDMYWGLDDELIEIENVKVLQFKSLRRVFDFIITLEDPILRGIDL